MVTALGWTFDQVNQLPFPDVLELYDYWSQYPPVHILLRGFVGYEPKGLKPGKGQLNAAEQRFAAQGATPYAALPPYVKDFIQEVAAKRHA